MRTPPKQGLAAGAAVLAFVMAAPAVWASARPSLQPPPGTVDISPAPAAPVPVQPAADAPAVRVINVAPVPRQPVNLHPVKAGPAIGLRHSKVDLGTQ